MATAPIRTGLIRNRSTPALIGALILFLAALVLVTIYMELLGREAYNDVQQADELLLTERDIFGSLLDMETGMRGYVIAGDEQFLQPYNQATQNLPLLWTDLMSGMTDMQSDKGTSGTALLQQAKDFKQAADTWQTQWAQVEVAKRRAGNEQETLNDLAGGQGKDLFDIVRSRNRVLDNSINSNLRIFSDEQNSIRSTELWIIVALGLLCLVGAVLTMRTFQRESQLEQKAAEDIDRERRQLQGVVDNLPVAVRLTDWPATNVILQNQPAEEIFPQAVWNTLNPDERIKYFDIRKLDGNPLEPMDGSIRLALQKGDAINEVELTSTLPNGPSRHLMVSATPLRDRDGNTTSSVIVIQDITRLKAIDQRKDEFIAVAAHELRNPLAALVGYNQLAQRTLMKAKASGADPMPTIERHLGEMSKQITRLNKLVERLLDASRIQLGKLTIEKTPTELVALAKDVCANAQTTDDGEHQIVMLAPDDLMVELDPTRISQVVTNLLDNALRYSPTGTTINVSVTRENDEARIEVKDQGFGMSDEIRAKLFSRYYGPLVPRIPQPQQPSADGQAAPQEGPPRIRKPGLGIGLYVSSEIVVAHGGKIGAISTPEGSTFWFTLPIISSASQAE